MIGGYENPDQSLPSGEGDFLFETNDPRRIEDRDMRECPPLTEEGKAVIEMFWPE